MLPLLKSIRALLKYNDEVIAENYNRVFSALLSNDLNLLFNLDRTIYVSKKGVTDGMKRTAEAYLGTGVSNINHFLK